MGRHSKVTDEIRAYVLERSSRGLTQGAIAAELAALGTPLAQSGVYRILAAARGRRAPLAPKQPAPVPVVGAGGQVKGMATNASGPVFGDPTEDTDAPPGDFDGLTSAELVKVYQDSIKSLQDIAMQAGIDGNTSAQIAALRVITQITAQLAKQTPPPVKDPNEMPDMIAVAEEARAGLRIALDRAKKRRAEQSRDPGRGSRPSG